MQQIEKDRRDFEIELFKMNERIQRDSQAIMKDSKAIVEREDKFTRRITKLIILLAILEVVGTFLALAYPNGFFWPSWLIKLLG